MDTETIRKRLGGKLVLPSLPAIVQEIVLMADDPGFGMKEVAEQLALDPPLAAKTVRVANSAYYGLSVRVTTLEHAASVLGMRTLKKLTLQAVVLELADQARSVEGFDPRTLWRRASLSAHVCTHLGVETLAAHSSEELFLCGLLHDIGEFVFLDQLGAEFVAVRAAASADGEGLVDAEKRAFGFTHCDLGALIAKSWALPETVARVVANHHDLAGQAEKDALVAAVAISDLIVEQAQQDLPQQRRVELLPGRVLARLGLTRTQAGELTGEAHVLWQSGYP